MRKQLFFIKNEQGFFLPYVLFISTLVFIIITANINSYRNDIQITDNYLEQLKIETLFQMGRSILKEEIKSSSVTADRVFYTFPEGTVEIELVPSSNERYELAFTINTNRNSTYSIINYLTVTGNTPDTE